MDVAVTEEFQEHLCQLEVLRRQLAMTHAAALRDLRAENYLLRSENETLRAACALLKTKVGSRGPSPPWPSTPKSLPPESVVLAGEAAGEASAGAPQPPAPPQLPHVVPPSETSPPAPLVLNGEMERPEKREPWPVWLRMSSEDATRSSTYMNLSAMVNVKEALRRSRTRSMEDLNIKAQARSTCVLHPGSGFVMAWTSLSGILLLYDAIMIPMDSGLPLPDIRVFKVMDILIAIYWALDVVRTFFTGYEDDSSAGVEMDCRKVAMRYGRTWFPLDLTLVVVDIFLTFAPSESSMGGVSYDSRASRVGRVWRVARVARLVRVLKLARRVWKYSQSALTLKQVLIMKSCYICLMDLFVCHYMACYWCALGDNPLIGGVVESSWKTPLGLDNAELGELYVVAVNWALAQSGFSTSDVHTTTILEHLYSIGVGFIWLMIVSVTISLFYTWMSETREATMEQVKESLRLRKFLEQRDVSRNLSYRIMRYFSVSNHAQDRIQEVEIKSLRDLPLQLQMRLHRELYLQFLRQHPFFALLGAESKPALVAICHLAVAERRYLAGETVFEEYAEAREMLGVLSGELDYYTGKAGAESTRLAAGDWCCEPALWRRWALRGRLVSVTLCELVAADVEKVHAVVEQTLDSQGRDRLPCLRRHVRKALTYFAPEGTQEDELPLDIDCLGQGPAMARSTKAKDLRLEQRGAPQFLWSALSCFRPKSAHDN